MISKRKATAIKARYTKVDPKFFIENIDDIPFSSKYLLMPLSMKIVSSSGLSGNEVSYNESSS